MAASFVGLEYCFVRTDVPEYNRLFQEMYAPGIPIDELFLDLLVAHPAVNSVRYWMMPEWTVGRFRSSLRRNDNAPLRISIDMDDERMVFTRSFAVLGDNWVYTQPLIGAIIMVRRTYTMPLQLTHAKFPAVNDWENFDGLIVPISLRIALMTGQNVCEIHAPLASTGVELAVEVLRAMGRSPAWDVQFISTTGQLLSASQPIGEWAFGPQSYLFAVPKHRKWSSDAALSAYFFNPISLEVGS